MARGTKLYQTPGSPLIQGHSKGERQFWREWLLGLMVGTVIALVALLVYGLDPDTTFGFSDIIHALKITLLLVVPGAALGAALGVSLARAFGWRREWLSAVVVGLMVGSALAWVLSLIFPAITG